MFIHRITKKSQHRISSYCFVPSFHFHFLLSCIPDARLLFTAGALSSAVPHQFAAFMFIS